MDARGECLDIGSAGIPAVSIFAVAEGIERSTEADVKDVLSARLEDEGSAIISWRSAIENVPAIMDVLLVWSS